MDLFKLSGEENYDKICAQVLFTTRGRLAYYCTLCGKYRDYEAFIEHLLEKCCQIVDDDLKECITRSSLTGSKVKKKDANLQPKRCKTSQEYTVPTQEKINEHKSPNRTDKIVKQSNQLLPIPFVRNKLSKRKKSTIFNDLSNLHIKKHDFNEKTIKQIDFNDKNCIKQDCGEDISDEYINVECLEDEIIESQISYHIEPNEQINEDSHLEEDLDVNLDEEYLIEYQLEQVNSQTPEDSQNSCLPDQNDLKHDDEKTNVDIVSETHNNTLNAQADIVHVVRNVRARKKYLPSHIAPEERKFKCPICGMAFKDNHNMRYHLKRHTNIKSHSCPDCDKKFYTSTEVKLHSRVHKKVTKTFLCTVCGLAFDTNYRLICHQKRHTNQRDYICNVCYKAFFVFEALKLHMSCHSSERPYSCALCAATFKLPGGLKSHMKQHENKREYKCQLCEAAFNVQSALHCHMKTKH